MQSSIQSSGDIFNSPHPDADFVNHSENDEAEVLNYGWIK